MIRAKGTHSRIRRRGLLDALGARELIADGKLADSLPVAAKMALHSTGAIGGKPGSPTPPSGTVQSDVGCRCTLISRGAALTALAARRIASSFWTLRQPRTYR